MGFLVRFGLRQGQHCSGFDNLRMHRSVNAFNGAALFSVGEMTAFGAWSKIGWIIWISRYSRRSVTVPNAKLCLSQSAQISFFLALKRVTEPKASRVNEKLVKRRWITPIHLPDENRSVRLFRTEIGDRIILARTIPNNLTA